MSNRRQGFTLIELLVVIAIIAILMSLLMPSVQKVREAASSLQCSNNLKNIGLACQMYHDTYKCLPTAGRPTGTNSYAAAKGDLTWAYQILPYVEQNALFESVVFNTSATPPAWDFSTIQGLTVALYFCPSRRSQSLYGGRTVSDYAANLGTLVYDSTSATPYAALSDGAIISTSTGFPNGFGRGVGMLHFPDGTSNTILVGERMVNLTLMQSTTDPQDDEHFFNGVNGDVARGSVAVMSGGILQGYRGPGKDVNTSVATCGGSPDPCDGWKWRFGSSHTAGVNVVMVGGTVHRIVFAVPGDVFWRLCNRADGQPVSSADYE